MKATGKPRKAQHRPGLTLEQARNFGLTFKDIWQAVRAGRIRPFDSINGETRQSIGALSFREFMAENGYEGPPGETWAPEDTAAWETDER